MIRNDIEVKELLARHPNPKVVIATTIKDGYVSCINPVPNLFGAELHCNESTMPSLKELLANKQG